MRNKILQTHREYYKTYKRISQKNLTKESTKESLSQKNLTKEELTC